MATSVLSPQAKPFHPSAGMMHMSIGVHPMEDFVIFNDGVPSCVPSAGQGEIIRGVSDEAIECNFPPTPEDIAELEETDEFVEILADLELVEDMEENSRQFADIEKRWAARRKDGIPVGSRPRQPRSLSKNEAKEVTGVPVMNHNKVVDDLVRYDHTGGKLLHHHGDSALMNASRERSIKTKTKNQTFKRSNKIGTHGYVKPIHQPRK